MACGMRSQVECLVRDLHFLLFVAGVIARFVLEGALGSRGRVWFVGGEKLGQLPISGPG